MVREKCLDKLSLLIYRHTSALRHFNDSPLDGQYGVASPSSASRTVRVRRSKTLVSAGLVCARCGRPLRRHFVAKTSFTAFLIGAFYEPGHFYVLGVAEPGTDHRAEGIALNKTHSLGFSNFQAAKFGRTRNGKKRRM